MSSSDVLSVITGILGVVGMLCVFVGFVRQIMKEEQQKEDRIARTIVYRLDK